MNGIHDMGGMHGFGKVEPEPNEPPFHAPWEGRALALNRAMGYAKLWTIDKSRYAIEQFPPAFYLTASYYKKWFVRLENLLIERGLDRRRRDGGRPFAAAGEAAQAQAHRRRHRARAQPRQIRAADERAGALRGRRPRAREEHPSAHAHPAAALCARQVGVIERVRGCHVFPTRRRSARARTRNGSTPCCSRAANCGARAPTRLTVSIEAFEPYLEPA